MATPLQTTLVRQGHDIVIDESKMDETYITLTQKINPINADVIILEKDKIRALITTLEKFEEKLLRIEHLNRNKAPTDGLCFEDKMNMDD